LTFHSLVSIYLLPPILSCSLSHLPPSSTLFPYTTLFRSGYLNVRKHTEEGREYRTVEVDPERAPLIQWAFATYAAGDTAVEKNLDRKSTRLNSSHVSISYAVFCLKKRTHTLAYPSSDCYR